VDSGSLRGVVTRPTLDLALATLLAALVTVLVVATLRADDGVDDLRRAAWVDADEGPGALTVRHRDVALAARGETLALLTVDHRNMDALVDRVLAGATGAFAREYAARRDALVRRAVRQQSVSSGTVAALGIDRFDGDSATVLVAANGRARNVSTNGTTQSRFYRLRLEMVRIEGRWLASAVERVE
jgi:Mce-associated membrane protein